MRGLSFSKSAKLNLAIAKPQKSNDFHVPACWIDIRFFLFMADDLPRKRLPQLYKPPTPEMLAYLDFSVSTTGMLTGVKVSCMLEKCHVCQRIEMTTAPETIDAEAKWLYQRPVGRVRI